MIQNSKTLRPIIKCHGGKRYLSKWLIEAFPEEFQEMDYYELFGGGGSVLLNKPKSRSETLNDLDTDLIAIWEVVKYMPESFVSTLNDWSYTQESFQKALDMHPESDFERAIKEYVLRRMSRGGLKKSFAWSKRLRNGKPGDVNAWETMLVHLQEIHERISKVTIISHSFEEVFEKFDGPESFFYLDPPYVKSTRTSINVYDHEMTDKQHELLLDLCNKAKGYVLLSGYQCPLYSRRLKNWNFHYRAIVNHSSQSSRKPVKLEGLWSNYR